MAVDQKDLTTRILLDHSRGILCIYCVCWHLTQYKKRTLVLEEGEQKAKNLKVLSYFLIPLFFESRITKTKWVIYRRIEHERCRFSLVEEQRLAHNHLSKQLVLGI